VGRVKESVQKLTTQRIFIEQKSLGPGKVVQKKCAPTEASCIKEEEGISILYIGK